MARPPSKRAAGPALDRGLLPSLLGYALRGAQSAVFADFSATFAQAGEALAPSEFGLMVLVGRNAGLSQTALAHALGIDRSTLVPILDRLQGRGLLVRRPSPTDGRTHALALTPLGSRTLAQFSRLVRDHERRIARGLSADETRLLIALLEKVRIGAGPL